MNPRIAVKQSDTNFNSFTFQIQDSSTDFKPLKDKLLKRITERGFRLHSCERDCFLVLHERLLADCVKEINTHLSTGSYDLLFHSLISLLQRLASETKELSSKLRARAETLEDKVAYALMQGYASSLDFRVRPNLDEFYAGLWSSAKFLPPKNPFRLAALYMFAMKSIQLPPAEVLRFVYSEMCEISAQSLKTRKDRMMRFETQRLLNLCKSLSAKLDM